jgi:hypothetical protein
MRVGGTGVLGAVENFRDPHTGTIAALIGRTARGVAIDEQGNITCGHQPGRPIHGRCC